MALVLHNSEADFLMTNRLHLACFVAVLTTPFASGATLSLSRSATLTCPVQTGSLFLGFQNRTGTSQTIPSGTVMTLTFTAPVRVSSVTGATTTTNGNTLT